MDKIEAVWAMRAIVEGISSESLTTVSSFFLSSLLMLLAGKYHASILK